MSGNPNIRPSDEVIAHGLEEALFIDHDWGARYRINVADFRDAEKALESSTDPVEVLPPVIQKVIASVCTLGSLALWVNSNVTLEQRRAFEAQFDDQ